MPVRGLQCLIRDDNARRASVLSAEYFGPHLLLLRTSRISVPVEAITDVEGVCGSAMKNSRR